MNNVLLRLRALTFPLLRLHVSVGIKTEIARRKDKSGSKDTKATSTLFSCLLVCTVARVKAYSQCDARTSATKRYGKERSVESSVQLKVTLVAFTIGRQHKLQRAYLPQVWPRLDKAGWFLGVSPGSEHGA